MKRAERELRAGHRLRDELHLRGDQHRGQTEVLRFDGGAHLPSQVFLEQDGKLLIGRAAGRAAARAPERFERSPKTELGYRELLLGDELVDPEEAVAAVLREVLAVAMRHENKRAPDEVRLTHPARWGSRRKNALVDAAGRAGITGPRLISEPEAAIHHFAHSPRVTISPGNLIAVYDLGGGTFDTAVLRCTGPDAFELAGPPGGTAGDEDKAEIGGDLFDRHVYEFCGRQIDAHDRPTWIAIRKPLTRDDRQAQRQLREDARDAKERLSSETKAEVWVERIEQDVLITREQFDLMIEKGIKRSIAILDETLASAGVRGEQLTALFLTGGSSRIPLIYDRVLAHFGRADTQDDPKAIVALGAARMDPPRAPAKAKPKAQAKPKPKPKPKPAVTTKPAVTPKPQAAPKPKPKPVATVKPPPAPSVNVEAEQAKMVAYGLGALVAAGVAIWLLLAQVIPGASEGSTVPLGWAWLTFMAGGGAFQSLKSAYKAFEKGQKSSR